MKILHLIPRFTAGGAEQLVLSYVEFMRKQGLTIAVGSVVGGPASNAPRPPCFARRSGQVACEAGRGELEEKFRKTGVDVFVGKNRGFVNFYRNFTRLRQCYGGQVEIIHSHVFSADVMGFLLARKLKIKWVSTQHNVETNAPLWRKFVWKIILRSADKVIAVSDLVYDFCLSEWRLPKDKIILIKNGIELEQWLAVSLDGLLTSPQLRLATIGRLETQKGHEILLRALAQLKINWHLDVFGDGSLKLKLQHLASELNIENKITWRGVVLDLPSELSKIDIVVQPSLWEGMSLVVMEAMASGRVVIASEPAAVGLIDNGKTGIVIKAGDVGAFARAIESVASDRHHARSLVVSARHHAQEHFDIQNNLNAVTDLYVKI